MSLFGPYMSAFGPDPLQRVSALAEGERPGAVALMVEEIARLSDAAPAFVHGLVLAALPSGQEALLDTITGRVAIYWDVMNVLGLPPTITPRVA